MTLDVRPCVDARELAAIVPQRRQAAALLVSSQEHYDAVLKSGPAFICYDEQGPLGAVGLSFRWRGRAEAWALVAERALYNPVGGMMVTTMARRIMDATDCERIECAVREDWERAHKWARALGFKSEGLMRKYYNGDDYRLYARVR